MKYSARIFVLFLITAYLGNFQSVASKLAGVQVIDKDYLMATFLDGEVVHRDDGRGPNAFEFGHEDDMDTVKAYGTGLNTTKAAAASSWSISSDDDPAFTGGKAPAACYRQMKLNGMAEKAWGDGDYNYEITNEHVIFIKLPASMTQGKTYTVAIDAATNTDAASATVKYDIYQCRSEALHVNLVGYSPDPSIKAADLYMWMGDGGARDYSTFAGKKVYLYNVTTSTPREVGEIALWKKNGSESQGYNLIQSTVWNADFSAVTDTGTFRLAVEDVGASRDFRIASRIYKEPFQVAVKGYFYMRIGQDSTGGIRPVPRRPLYIPGKDPANTIVYLTTLQPFDKEWKKAFPDGGGDPWDNKTAWADYKKSGTPANPRAIGGHADAADWDRHLGHVCNIYDMLLPYILTKGALSDDDIGIAESGNGIPDIIDEARNEVDYWLHLRDGQGYSQGVNNPDDNNVFYQAGTNAMAAWANAANAAMLAEAFRIAGNTALMNEYRDSAIAAYKYADGLADKLLDSTQGEGESVFRGRDFKATAAGFLYNVTGEAAYEQALNDESLCKSGSSADLDDHSKHDQLYAAAAYLTTPQTRNFPALYDNLKACVVSQAKKKHVDYSDSRPSRRSSDDATGWFQTEQNVQMALVAHAVADNTDKAALRKAIVLEADWGLGRNPLNMIQMTTASTSLGGKRSVVDMYTSGRNDGTPGMHPGHTPYMNSEDWGGLIMGNPSWMTSKTFPAFDKWPKADCYFNTRYVYAHSEFTPQQTMRGKLAIYGYLYGLGKIETGGGHTIGGWDDLGARISVSRIFILQGNRLSLLKPGEYQVNLLDISGRRIWSRTIISNSAKALFLPKSGNGPRIILVRQNGISVSRSFISITE